MDNSEDISIIIKQEQALVFKEMNADLAWDLGAKIRELAQKRNVSVSMEIKLAGHILFHGAMPGTTADNADWIRRKSNLSARMQKSSYAISLMLLSEGMTLREKFLLDEMDYAPHGGSFPLRIEGVGCVGTITVSGIPQREDHNLVVDAIAAFLGVDINRLSSVY